MNTPKQEEQQSLGWLSDILDILRHQCSWDRAQTIDSLRYLTLEECYELSDAILQRNDVELRKELGDLFMHILFYAKLGEAEGRFTLVEIIDGICQKLIARHPHIALPNRDGLLQAATTAERPAWEQVKMKEGRCSVLEGVPASLPTLLKSVRIQEKAAGVGYEFACEADAFAKVQEEYRELCEAIAQRETLDQRETAMQQSEEAACSQAVTAGEAQSMPSPASPQQAHVEEEYGDLLFALVKWGHFLGVNADDALAKANAKYQRRFTYMEYATASRQRPFASLTLQEMRALWKEAKECE